MFDAELARLGRKDLGEPLRKVVEVSGGVEILGRAEKLLGGAGREGFEYLRQLAGLLTANGVGSSDYAFDMGVGRGLGYYTGMVFEIVSPDLRTRKQVRRG